MMNKNLLLVVFTWLNFSLSISAQNQSKLQALQINDKLIANADAVIRQDEMSFNLVSQSEILIKRNRIVTVFNELGQKHVMAYINIDKYTEVKEIEAFIYDAEGNEVKKFKQKNFIEENIIGDVGLYPDHKLLKIEVEGMGNSYPYTVHFTYEITTTNTAFIPKYYFVENYGVSIEEASCRMNFNGDELTVKEKENGFNENIVKKYKIKGNVTYSIMNFEAITPEPLSPEFNTLAPNVQFAVNRFSYNNNKSDALTCGKIGMWYYNEILKTSQLPQGVITEAKSIASRGANSLEKIELIYKYVKK